MERERRNHYYGDDGQNEEFDNNYNRFDGGEQRDYSEEHRQRPRFVRVDSGNRQYSRVERNSRTNESDNQGYDRPRAQYRQQDGERSYRSNRGGYDRPYGQRQQGGYRSYNQNGQSQDQSDGQMRFYRDRAQNGEGGQMGQERPYRPRQNYAGGQQGGYSRNNQYGNGGYGQPRKKKPAIPKGKRIEYQESVHDPNEEIRLNKFLANAGVCSRREADDFIKAGVVKVNGETVTELGSKVRRGDNVLFHDQLVSIERKIYILLNKPKDCVTTVDDPQERKTVMDYVRNACHERIYPVGRLDRNTTGVLLLTNDGELATRLTHPKYLKKKIYHARLDRNVTSEDLDKLLTGVDIGDGDLVAADEASYVNEDRSQIGIEIHSGRNRVVRRMFDALGYKVTRLDSVQFAGLTKKRLRRGDWRFLTDKEVNMLRMGAYE